MTTRAHIRTLALALAATLTLAPAALAAERTTETIRVFSTPVSFTYTGVEGTVTQGPPAGPPRAGDVFEIDSRDYRGNHKRHARRPAISDYLRCTFLAGPEPDCYGYVAIGGSLLRFHNFEVIGGTGRYQGATGTTIKNQEVRGGSDVVVRVTLR